MSTAPTHEPDPGPKAPHRRHSEQFKQQVCREIRSGSLGRRDAQKKYKLSDNLLQQWLARYDGARAAEAPRAPPARRVAADHERRIEALERQVQRLARALDRREPEAGG